MEYERLSPFFIPSVASHIFSGTFVFVHTLLLGFARFELASEDKVVEVGPRYIV